jgi:hypothetical protein
MRAIDLSCSLLAPLAAGMLMTHAGMLVATIVIGSYSLLFWMPELALLRLAYQSSERLR